MSLRKLLVFSLLVALVLGTLGIAVAQDNTLLIWTDDTRTPVMQSLVDRVREEIGIELEIVEVALNDGRDQLLVSGPVGEGPDVLIIPHDHLGQLVVNGALAPIDLGDKVDSFSESALDMFTFQNQLWGVPYAIENVALIRNVDLVPEAPATWQEVREISEQLRADDTFGFAIQDGDTYHHFGITTAFGGYIFGRDEDGSFDVTDIGLGSEGGLASAEWLGGMYADDLMPVGVGNDEIFAKFEDGELGMFITGPWFSQRIIDTGVNYSIDPLPGAEEGLDQGAPFSGGQGFVISAFSDNQLLAEIFVLDFIATPELMQSLFDVDPRLPTFEGVDIGADPNIDDFVAAGSNAIPMPQIPEMNAVWGAAGNALTLVAQGEDPVATYQTAVDQILTAIESADE